MRFLARTLTPMFPKTQEYKSSMDIAVILNLGSTIIFQFVPQKIKKNKIVCGFKILHIVTSSDRTTVI